MDIHEAYRKLGLSEDATEKEIESQYMLRLRRHKANKGQHDAEEPINIDAVSTAYQTIMTYKKHGSESSTTSETFRDKLDHFFRYYKLHTISVIAVLLVIIGIAQTFIDNWQEQKELASLPPASVEVMFYGSYLNTSFNTVNKAEKMLADNILAKFPSWERVDTTLNYFPLEVNDSSDLGIQQKSAAMFATEKPDLYIMDLALFQLHVTSGMFYPLDQMDSSFIDESVEDKLYYSTTETNSAEHLYGIEITDETIFNGVPFRDDVKKIAAIRKDGVNKQNALQLMLKFANITE